MRDKKMVHRHPSIGKDWKPPRRKTLAGFVSLVTLVGGLIDYSIHKAEERDYINQQKIVRYEESSQKKPKFIPIMTSGCFAGSLFVSYLMRKGIGGSG